MAHGSAWDGPIDDDAVNGERLEDRRLVRRMLRGDEAAFEEFFAASFPALYRFALRRVKGDEDAAEEVVQRTLCIAVDRLATWRGEAALLTWLCAICRHQVADHYRRIGRRGEQVELSDDLPEVRAALESMIAVEGNPEEHVLQREVVALVHAALDTLPPRYARVLEWKYLEEASMKEIAVRMGSTVKAVESLLTRARVAYRDVLGAVIGGSGSTVARGEKHG